MEKRVPSLLIGKDIARTAGVTSATTFAGLASNLADGEVVVVDKHKVPLAAGSTIADSDGIYILQGSSETFDYTPESGSAVTGARKVISSALIEGAKVISFKGESFAAFSQQSDAWDMSSLTPVVDTVYLIRLVYKDINEHPGRYTQTYRYTAQSGDAAADVATGLAAAINTHSGARVTATVATSTLTITGKPIPESTTSVDDIDKFSIVEFDSYFNYVDSNNDWASATGTKTTTVASYGSGNWEQVRDLEKVVRGYRGFTNQTTFPILGDIFDTVKSETYDLIVIESYVHYDAPNNQGIEYAPHTTMIALPDGASQTADVLGVLNPWMASCPGAFTNISL